MRNWTYDIVQRAVRLVVLLEHFEHRRRSKDRVQRAVLAIEDDAHETVPLLVCGIFQSRNKRKLLLRMIN